MTNSAAIIQIGYYQGKQNKNQTKYCKTNTDLTLLNLCYVDDFKCAFSYAQHRQDILKAM